MQTEAPQTNTSTDLFQTARAFLDEMKGTAERSKKSLPSVPGLQCFLLYIRSGGQVPKHQVAGPITVQTLLGHAQMEAEGRTYDLPAGSIAPFAAGVPHDVAAPEETVLLVTHCLKS